MRILALPSAALVVLALLGAGCASGPGAVPAASTPSPADDAVVPAASRPFALDALSDDDILMIKSGILKNVPLQAVRREDSWSVPDGIDPMQISEGAASPTDDLTLFAFVDQPNQSKPLWMASGISVFGQPGAASFPPVNFAGVLFSQDSGATWHITFSIPPASPQKSSDDDLAPFNPVGMFTEGGKLWLDLMDGAGAGSGEGTLVRYSTADGKTWKRQAGCQYFVPESYVDPSGQSEDQPASGIAQIRPHGLKPTACPSYVSKLPN